jgi:nitroimidazol reductase NimA-like FMN-containing flavoprotein (pyridoxamine 5'-phosphate oxidase superfamily)
MTQSERPVLYELPHTDALELLSRHRVGRLAFAFHDHVDIEPISYLFHDGWIYARTSPGTKLTVVRHSPWVAFEVDEIESRFDWRSVVIHGTIYFFDPSGGDRDREAYATALELMRTVDADVLTTADPAPHRSTLFRVHADEIIGRASRTAK